MKKNIIFHLIMTNQCNKRCDYCDLNFDNNVFSYTDLDNFIEFINKNYNDFNEIRVNFFWGEPLLEFQRIEHVLHSIKAKNIFYSLVTNGILLTENKYLFLKKFNTEINYSIDTETYSSIFKHTYIDFQDKNFVVNFIMNPKTIHQSSKIFLMLEQLQIKNINILPVYITIWWEKSSLLDLNIFIEQIKNKTHINLQGLSYYEKPTSDIEYIIENNWKIYTDVHTHLWFIKQYDIISHTLKNTIEMISYLWNIKSIVDIINESDKISIKIKDIYRLSLQIPKYQNCETEFKIINKILFKLNDK